MNSRNTRADLVNETKTQVEADKIAISLSMVDSDKLSKSLSKVSIQPIPAPGIPKSVPAPEVFEFGKDLSFECVSSSEGQLSKACTVSMNRKPVSNENFLTSDESTGEFMFQLRNVADAKRLYSTLNVKEWDLQGSTYKRFSTSDNKMILECVLDAERSRCSIFIGDGRSDDLND